MTFSWKKSGAFVLALVLALSGMPAWGGNAQTFSDLRVTSSSAVPTHAMSLLRQTGTVQRVGNFTIAYEVSPSMVTTSVIVLRNGKEARVDGVPVSALDARAILRNQNRIVWAEATDNSARFDVYELDLEQGARVRHLDDIFLGSASKVNVRVDGTTFYFEVQHMKTFNNGLPQVEILRATSTSGHTEAVSAMWRNQFETIEDVDDGRVVTRVIFENGDQELWIHENGASRAIPDSYTVNGYLLGTQFVGKTIEFFRYQRLMRYDVATWKTETLNDRLLWERDILTQMERFVAFGGAMFFVTYNEGDGRHYVMRRKSGVTSTISVWEGSPFVLNGTFVSFARADQFANGYDTYHLPTGIHVLHDGGIQWVSVYSSARVIVDKDGRVVWHKGAFDRVIGTAPQGRAHLVDNTHVAIPQGAGKPVVFVTVRPQSWLLREGATFAKFPKGSTVYLFKDGKRYTVQNEEVFYSWERNFSRVVDMALINTNAYVDGGMAPYAPGTMIKAPGKSTVYTVLNEKNIEPIMSEAAALELYGPHWWLDVHSVSQAQMDRFSVVTLVPEE